MKCPQCGHISIPVPSMKGAVGAYMRALARQLLSHPDNEISSREIEMLIVDLCLYRGGEHDFPRWMFNGPRRYLQCVGAITHPPLNGRRTIRTLWQINRGMLERLTETSQP